MTSLKPVARRAALAATCGVALMSLAACSAGQISQTANQVAAVDGVEVGGRGEAVVLRDVKIVVEDDGTRYLVFAAINQDTTRVEDVELEGITVDGQAVDADVDPLGKNCSVVADVPDYIETYSAINEDTATCAQYITIDVDQTQPAPGGHSTVVFSFSTGDIEITNTPISAALTVSGEYNRAEVRGEGFHEGGYREDGKDQKAAAEEAAADAHH